MKLKELIEFKNKLPQGAAEIISGNTVLLAYTDEGLLSCGTLANHKSTYNNYRIVHYDSGCESFLFIEEG